MKWRRVGLLAVLAAGLGGCGQGVTITWTRPPEAPLPQDVRSVEVGRFDGRGAQERRWAEAAAEAVRTRLVEAARQDGRLQVWHRPEPGMYRHALADAELAGRIEINLEITRGESDAADAADAGRIGRNRAYRGDRLACAVVLTVTLQRTGEGTIFTRRLERRYDTGPGGLGARRELPADEVVRRLIDQCADDLLASLFSREMTAREKLAAGKGKCLAAGNRLAGRGRYAEALESYRQGLAANPGDVAAEFNAGLMCELLGKLPEARLHYLFCGRTDAARRVELRLAEAASP